LKSAAIKTVPSLSNALGLIRIPKARRLLQVFVEHEIFPVVLEERLADPNMPKHSLLGYGSLVS